MPSNRLLVFFLFLEITYQKNWARIWCRVHALIINFDNSIAKTGMELVGLLKYSKSILYKNRRKSHLRLK